jgi:hypothetical protein
MLCEAYRDDALSQMMTSKCFRDLKIEELQQVMMSSLAEIHLQDPSL